VLVHFDENAFNRSLAPLAAHIAALGVSPPEYKPYSGIRFEDQARVLLDAKVPVFSFIYGIPPQEILEECRAKHVFTIGTATTPEEGAALQEAGVDAVVASGFEAGGHRGSFLRAAEDSLSSAGFTREKGRAHRADKGLHRKTRAGNPQPLAGGVEPEGNGDSTLSVATKTRQKSRDPGRGGGPIGSPAPMMGWAKCQSVYLHRRIGFFDLIGRRDF
jgi:hypothetical protein